MQIRKVLLMGTVNDKKQFIQELQQQCLASAFSASKSLIDCYELLDSGLKFQLWAQLPLVNNGMFMRTAIIGTDAIIYINASRDQKLAIRSCIRAADHNIPLEIEYNANDNNPLDCLREVDTPVRVVTYTKSVEEYLKRRRFNKTCISNDDL